MLECEVIMDELRGICVLCLHEKCSQLLKPCCNCVHIDLPYEEDVVLEDNWVLDDRKIPLTSEELR